jgi:hypothetical protein
MTLERLYKAFGAVHILMGVIFFAGAVIDPSAMGLPERWADSSGNFSIGIATMAEHFASALIVIGYMFWKLPGWTSEDQLKSATTPLIWAQIFLFLMPVYHVLNGSINADASFYVQGVILLAFIVLFFQKVRA